MNLGPAGSLGEMQHLLERCQFVGPALDSDDQRVELVGWAARLAPCFGAVDLASQCQLVNGLLAEATSKPYISLHDGRPHLHYRPMSASVPARVR
nr:hypothetical protein [Micromonospora sp. DSM 115978]